MRKLKPRPFCGGKARIEQQGKMFSVCCFNENLNCKLTPYTEFYYNDYDAVEAWNRRAEPEVKVGCWLENTDGTHFCSECQSEAHGIVFDTFFTENLDDYCYNCGAKMEREQND